MSNKYIRWILIAGAGIIIAINVIVASASSSSFCATCHRTQAKALEVSTHYMMRCNMCHQRNDFFDVFAWRARVVGMVARQATFSYKPPVTAQVSRATCLKCHQRVLVEVTRRDAIKVSHKEINDASYKCTDCHNTVAHPNATTVKKFPTMDMCSECHNDQRVSAECKICHMVEMDRNERVTTTWSITHGSQWKRLHGMGNLNTCRTCHGGKFCLKCHNAVLPHPDFWVRLHSGEAKVDIKGCYQCHHKSYCRSCHGLDMPHGDVFYKNHGRQVKKEGAKLCNRCHLTSGCDGCHVRHIHPGLQRDRLKQLRRSAGLD